MVVVWCAYGTRPQDGASDLLPPSAQAVHDDSRRVGLNG